jgi:hypothetical protein
MAVPQLRVVTSNEAAKSQNAFERIDAAVQRMMADARCIRIAAASLARSQRELTACASHLKATLPMFEEAERKLMVERNRAHEIANDAALIERRILQSSPRNIAQLTTGLPPRLLQNPTTAPHAA